jgi:hypothetical protein
MIPTVSTSLSVNGPGGFCPGSAGRRLVISSHQRQCVFFGRHRTSALPSGPAVLRTWREVRKTCTATALQTGWRYSIHLTRHQSLQSREITISLCQLQQIVLFGSGRPKGSILAQRGREFIALFDRQNCLLFDTHEGARLSQCAYRSALALNLAQCFRDRLFGVGRKLRVIRGSSRQAPLSHNSRLHIRRREAQTALYYLRANLPSLHSALGW